MSDAKKIIAYVGGSADNTSATDQCGWGYTFYMQEDSGVGTDMKKTSVQMEMYAVLNALKAIKDTSVPVEIRTNNEVVVKTMQGIYKDNENKELWEKLFAERERFDEGVLTFKHIPNDIGDSCLEEVHDRAKDEAKNKGVSN